MRKSLLLFASLVALSWSYSVGNAQSTPTGKIAYMGNGGLHVIDLVTGIDTQLTASGINPKLSPDGTRVVFAGSGGKKDSGIFAINVNGTGLTQLATFGIHPAWSPDGTRIAFGSNGIWVMDASGLLLTQLTDHGAWPAFSLDATKIAFCSTKNTGIDYDLWIMNADGTSTQPLLTQAGADVDLSWSPSSKLIFSHYVDRKSSYDVCVLDPVTNTLTRFANPGQDIWPSWSPDGAWITYAGPASPSSRGIYIMKADGTGLPVILVYGSQPSWGP